VRLRIAWANMLAQSWDAGFSDGARHVLAGIGDALGKHAADAARRICIDAENALIADQAVGHEAGIRTGAFVADAYDIEPIDAPDTARLDGWRFGEQSVVKLLCIGGMGFALAPLAESRALVGPPPPSRRGARP
jgi:hypothetical protein